MLKAEPDSNYRVWPSWANSFSFKWNELPRLLADPIAAGFASEDDLRSLKMGIVEKETRIGEFYSGKFGNGVFQYTKLPDKYWFGEIVFNRECSVEGVPGYQRIKRNDVARIDFLTLRGDAGLRLLGEGILKRPREYTCRASIEHVDSVGEDVFWLIDYTPARNLMKGLDAISAIGESFGLHIEEVKTEDMPKNILEETDPWFPNRNTMLWYSVKSTYSGAGLHFALMYYCALHLRSIASRRMRSMHLIAQIEGQPHIRRQWSRGIQDGTAATY